MNKRVPRFYQLLLQSMRVLLAQNSDYTGRVVITVHCTDGEAKTVAVDAPETPKRWEELEEGEGTK